MIPIAFAAEDGPAKSKFILLVVVRQFCCLALEYFKTNLAGSVTLAMAQFTPFEIGQIKAHAYHGMSGAAISRILVKPESTSSRLCRKSWSEQAVQDAMKKLQDFPQWRGERDEGSGRPGMPASSSIISCLPWLPASIPLLTLNPRKLAILLS